MAKRGSLHIVAKFTLAYIVLAATLGGVFAYVYYNQFSSASVESIRVQAKATADGLASSVDFSGFDTLREEGDVDSDVYRRIDESLDYVVLLNDQVLRVYALRPFTENEWVVVIDQGNEMPLGMLQDVSCCSDLRLGLVEPSASPQFVEGPSGSYITGYAPIRSSSGNVIGVLAVDIAADDYVQLQRLLERNVVITLVVTLMFALIFGVVGIAMFIREDQRIRRALEIRNEDLERSVKQRTKSLQEFMAVIVHDLKAPLTAMNWGLQSIEESVRKKSVRDELSRLTGVIGSMRHFVQTILDASKLSLGKMPIRKTEGDLVLVLEASIEEFKKLAKDAGLKLAFEKKKLPKFMFDAERVKQVMENLLSNAVKFTPKGGAVSVRATHEVEAGIVRIEVEDSGMGISKTDAKKMFAPFMRGINENEGGGGNGSGLGLSIVRGIVEAHGGKVGVESHRGKGSVFWVELPTANVARVQTSEDAQEEEGSDGEDTTA